MYPHATLYVCPHTALSVSAYYSICVSAYCGVLLTRERDESDGEEEGEVKQVKQAN